MFIVNRRRRDKERSTPNRTPLYRPMIQQNLLLQRYPTAKAPGYRREGKDITAAPTLRWVSDSLELRCENGEIVRMTFAIDTYSQQIIGWTAGTAGFTGDSLRDFMRMCVKRRFGQNPAPHAVEWLSDRGRINTSHETVAFATGLGLLPRFAPLGCTAFKGVAESFARTFLVDYLYAYGRRDAATVLGQLDSWFEDYGTRSRRA